MTTERLQYVSDAFGSMPDQPVLSAEQKEQMFSGTESFLQENKKSEYDFTTHNGLISYTYDPHRPIKPQIVMSNNFCAMSGGHGVDTNKLLLTTKDDVIFRLFLTEMTDFSDSKFQNRFSKLLRCLGEKQTLHIYTGNGVYGAWPLFDLGTILDAIARTRCKVTVHINGRASFCETCLWMWAENREISEFGTLFFCGMQRHLEWSPTWYGYLSTLLSRGVELGVLTQKECDDLLTTNKDIQFKQREVVERLNRKLVPPTEDDPAQSE